jgi:hypothetical protein
MRERTGYRAVGPQFSSHAAFSAAAVAYEDHLTRAQLGEAKTAQRLHVHEDIRSAISACQEAEAPHPVKPLNHGALPLALWPDLHVGALRQLRGVDRCALIHAQNAECLQAPGTAKHFAVDACAFIGHLVAASAQASYMKKDVSQTVVRHDESVPFGCIEPLDCPRNFEDIDGRRVLQFLTEIGLSAGQILWHLIIIHQQYPAVTLLL